MACTNAPHVWQGLGKCELRKIPSLRSYELGTSHRYAYVHLDHFSCVKKFQFDFPPLPHPVQVVLLYDYLKPFRVLVALSFTGLYELQTVF